MIADKKLAKISRTIDLKHFNPSNLNSEKSKFFASKTYNPQFTYNPVKYSFKLLKSISYGYRPIDQLMKAKGKELRAQLLMRKFLGTKKFTNFSKRAYGFPNEKLIEKAKIYITRVPSKTRETTKGSIPSSVVQKLFLNEISLFSNKWTVLEAPILAKAMVNPTNKTVYIKKNDMFTKIQVDRLIAHEIYGHVLRSVCGEMQPYKMVSIGFAKYESTEEGLALYKEKKLVDYPNEF